MCSTIVVAHLLDPSSSSSALLVVQCDDNISSVILAVALQLSCSPVCVFVCPLSSLNCSRTVTNTKLFRTVSMTDEWLRRKNVPLFSPNYLQDETFLCTQLSNSLGLGAHLNVARKVDDVSFCQTNEKILAKMITTATFFLILPPCLFDTFTAKRSSIPLFLLLQLLLLLLLFPPTLALWATMVAVVV